MKIPFTDLLRRLGFISYATQRDAGATASQCAHQLAFGAQAAEYEQAYQECKQERLESGIERHWREQEESATDFANSNPASPLLQ